MKNIILSIVGLGVLYILMLFLNSQIPKIRGIIGEKRISKQLNQLQKSEYLVLDDIILKTEKGTTQIDHIVISIYGIFVIETKNYSGWIYGNEREKMWTQTLGKNKKYKFYNPLWQNYGHVQAVKSRIFGNPVTIFSIVTFSDGCKIKTELDKEKVCHTSTIAKTIKIQQTQLLSYNEMLGIYFIFEKEKNENAHLKKQHLQSVKEKRE